MALPTDTDYLKPLLKNWNVDVSGVFPEAWIAGSPERTLCRMVIVDPGEQAFVLEEISSPSIGRKKEIAGLLGLLSQNGLAQVYPYRPDRQGEIITEHAGRYWQLRDYLQGSFLQRPEYLDESWRGVALADFLIGLHESSEKIQVNFRDDAFSIIRFIDDFEKKLKIHRSDLLEELSPVLACLAQDFFRIHDTLPTGLCHGDYHPLNVIWSEDAILSVIDWEFCGLKPEAYDLALLIGCIGIEDPHALKGPLINGLLSRVEESGIYHEQSRACLLDLVMALRFAWLSEWLRKDDQEMVRLELDYLDLLLANRLKIKEAWKRASLP